MFQYEQRDTQTQIKHLILSDYLKAWTHIITSGLAWRYQQAQSRGSRFTSSFIYVDPFANVGKYLPEDGEEALGSPIIGIQNLDYLRDHVRNLTNGFDPYTAAVLVEREPKRYNILLATLEEYGFSHRLRGAGDLHRLKNGEIAVINDDYLNQLDGLTRLTNKDNYTWSFYFLDPYGPTGIPLSAVERVISQPRCDTIINMPYQDLHKKTGSAAKQEPDPRHVPLLDHYDEMYGSDVWREVATRYYQTQITKPALEATLVDLYIEALQTCESDMSVKKIPLKFKDRERTMMYLLLTTHDATGALTMNKILDDAKIVEYDLRERHRMSVEQMSLFDTRPYDKNRPTEREPDVNATADEIYNLCKNETLELRKVLKRLANSPYYPDDVRKAMTALRRQRRVSYDGDLRHSTVLKFH